MKTVLACFLVAVLANVSFAQQGKEQPQPGHYQIATAKDVLMDSMVLMDTWTGKTWRLEGSTWLPLTRLETADQVKEYRSQQEKQKATVPLTASQRIDEMRKQGGR